MREILDKKPVEQFPSVELTDQVSDETDSEPSSRKHLIIEDLTPNAVSGDRPIAPRP